MFRRRLEQVPLNLSELPILDMDSLIAQVATGLQFAFHPLLDGVAEPEALRYVRPDDPPVVRLGEQPPQQTLGVQGQAWVVHRLVGEDCEIASALGPMDGRSALRGAVRKEV